MGHRPLAHAAASVRSSSWLRSNVQPLAGRPVCRPQSCQVSSAAPAKHCFARVVLPQLVSCGYAVAPERDGAVGPQGTEKRVRLCRRSWCLRRWHTCTPEMNTTRIAHARDRASVPHPPFWASACCHDSDKDPRPSCFTRPPHAVPHHTHRLVRARLAASHSRAEKQRNWHRGGALAPSRSRHRRA